MAIRTKFRYVRSVKNPLLTAGSFALGISYAAGFGLGILFIINEYVVYAAISIALGLILMFCSSMLNDYIDKQNVEELKKQAQSGIRKEKTFLEEYGIALVVLALLVILIVVLAIQNNF